MLVFLVQFVVVVQIVRKPDVLLHNRSLTYITMSMVKSGQIQLVDNLGLGIDLGLHVHPRDLIEDVIEFAFDVSNHFLCLLFAVSPNKSFVRKVKLKDNLCKEHSFGVINLCLNLNNNFEKRFPF